MKRLCSLMLLAALPVAAATTEECFSELLQERYSGYSYDAEKPLPKGLAMDLAKAASSAPSSYNDQPWRFLICDREETPEAYEQLLHALVEPNQKWAKNAPLLIVSLANKESRTQKGPNRWGMFDTGAAAMLLVLKATSMGLMAHEMGGFDAKQLATDFKIPKNFVPMSVIAVGYPAADSERPERKRQPLSENFFLGEWGKSL